MLLKHSRNIFGLYSDRLVITQLHELLLDMSNLSLRVSVVVLLRSSSDKAADAEVSRTSHDTPDVSLLGEQPCFRDATTRHFVLKPSSSTVCSPRCRVASR